MQIITEAVYNTTETSTAVISQSNGSVMDEVLARFNLPVTLVLLFLMTVGVVCLAFHLCNHGCPKLHPGDKTYQSMFPLPGVVRQSSCQPETVVLVKTTPDGAGDKQTDSPPRCSLLGVTIGNEGQQNARTV